MSDPVRHYDHVIFDLDGTLVDTVADLTSAMNRMLHEVARPPLTRVEVRGFIGDGARMLVQRGLKDARPEDVESALRSFLDHYAAHLLDQSQAYPGVPAALATLHAAGVVLSVLTNKPEGMSKSILDGLGLLPSFDFVIGGDTLGVRKPDPTGVRELSRRTKILRQRTLLVGDSSIDAHTALAADVAFCGVAWGFAPGALQELGAAMIDSPEELLSTVGVAT